MPLSTPDVEDILDKVEAYQAAKAASDAAMADSNTANTIASSARAEWEALVAGNVTDAGQLEIEMNQVIDTQTEANAKAQAAMDALNAANTAKSALDNKLYELTNPPGP